MKLLFVVPHPIDPPDRGNKHHTLNILRRVAEEHDVDVIAFDEGSDRSGQSWERVTKSFPRVRVVLRAPKMSGAQLVWERFTSLLRLRPAALGRYRRREVFKLLESSSGRYDAVCFDMFMTAEGREHCRGTPAVLLVTDAYSMTYRRSWMLPVSPLRRLRFLLEEYLQARFERSIYPTFQRLLVVSPADVEWLSKTAPGAQYVLVPVPLEASVTSAAPVRHIATTTPTLYCWAGVRNDTIALGVRDFLEQAWPSIRLRCAGAQCVIWGSSPHRLLDRARSIPGVSFIEYVDDWVAELRKAAVMVYPQRCGAGVQTKMQSAMALGVPCVLTPEAAAGLPAIDGTTCMVRDSVAGLADACSALLGDASLRVRVGSAGRDAAQRAFDPDRVATVFMDAMRAAAGGS